MNDIELFHGDCLELMKNIPDGSVDMILCDLPYGTIKGAGLDGWDKSQTAWDERLDTDYLFNEYERILRENGTAILFSQEPYTAELRRQTNLNVAFAYPLIWKKNHFANALISKKAPVSYYEDLSVFYKVYDRQNVNPLRMYSAALLSWIGIDKKKIIEAVGQKADHFFRFNSSQYKLCTEKTYNELIQRFRIDKWEQFRSYTDLSAVNSRYKRIFNIPDEKKCIGNVLEFSKEYRRFHETQKPIALLEYLIRIYSNEGDTVLDNCMGSGSTGVACVNTGRKFIGMELNQSYFNIAVKRIQEAEGRCEDVYSRL